MTAPRYGIKNPDGSYTGGISESYSLACAYARTVKGTVYTVGGPDDPEGKA